MPEDSAYRARVRIATEALLKKSYPEEIYSVLVDDETLPAYREAREKAIAVIDSLNLDQLFSDLAAAQKAAYTHESSLNYMQEDLLEARKMLAAERAGKRTYQKNPYFQDKWGWDNDHYGWTES